MAVVARLPMMKTECSDVSVLVGAVAKIVKHAREEVAYQAYVKIEESV